MLQLLRAAADDRNPGQPPGRHEVGCRLLRYDDRLTSTDRAKCTQVERPGGSSVIVEAPTGHVDGTCSNVCEFCKLAAVVHPLRNPHLRKAFPVRKQRRETDDPG